MPHLSAHFNAAATLAGKADMLRVELIHTFGGVYVDVDIECLRPIDDLLVACDCFAACEYDPASNGLTGPAGITNALFGAAPGHPAIQAIIDGVGDAFMSTDPLASGPKLFRRVLHARPDVRIFEKDIFCPLLPHESRLLPTREGDFPASYAVHWFNLSWRTAASNGEFASAESVSYGSIVTGRFGDVRLPRVGRLIGRPDN